MYTTAQSPCKVTRGVSSRGKVSIELDPPANTACCLVFERDKSSRFHFQHLPACCPDGRWHMYAQLGPGSASHTPSPYNLGTRALARNGRVLIRCGDERTIAEGMRLDRQVGSPFGTREQFGRISPVATEALSMERASLTKESQGGQLSTVRRGVGLVAGQSKSLRDRKLRSCRRT